jgi:hypothetical protein
MITTMSCVNDNDHGLREMQGQDGVETSAPSAPTSGNDRRSSHAAPARAHSRTTCEPSVVRRVPPTAVAPHPSYG